MIFYIKLYYIMYFHINYIIVDNNTKKELIITIMSFKPWLLKQFYPSALYKLII